MIILVIEDMMEQIKIAKCELSALGFKVAVAQTLRDAFRLMETLKADLKGIITDLHFPESDEEYFIENTSSNPNGLAVIAAAVLINKPIAVCSNVDHHYCAYIKTVIETFSSHQCYTHGQIPFIKDNKNWREAGEALKKLINKTST